MLKLKTDIPILFRDGRYWNTNIEIIQSSITITPFKNIKILGDNVVAFPDIPSMIGKLKQTLLLPNKFDKNLISKFDTLIIDKKHIIFSNPSEAVAYEMGVDNVHDVACVIYQKNISGIVKNKIKPTFINIYENYIEIGNKRKSIYFKYNHMSASVYYHFFATNGFVKCKNEMLTTEQLEKLKKIDSDIITFDVEYDEYDSGELLTMSVKTHTYHYISVRCNMKNI